MSSQYAVTCLATIVWEADFQAGCIEQDLAEFRAKVPNDTGKLRLFSRRLRLLANRVEELAELLDSSC